MTRALLAPLGSLTLIALLLLAAPAARAEGMYLTEAQLLAKLFPDAPQTTAEEVTLSDPEAQEVERLLGYRLEGRRYHCVTVADASGYKGQVLLLDVLGQNSPITFGVGVTASGLVRGVEVVAYREPRGGEIRNARFLRQLEGKSLSDRLAVGADVDAVTGATISSRSATFAARKGLALAQVLRARHPAAQAHSGQSTGGSLPKAVLSPR